LARRTRRSGRWSVCAQATESQRLKEEIAWFAAGSLRLLLLPDWKPALRSLFSAHDWFGAAWRRSTESCARISTSPSSRADRPHAARAAVYLAGRSFFIKAGEALDLAALRSSSPWRVQPRHAGRRAGEFCVRGGLVDLFPMAARYPTARSDRRGDRVDPQLRSRFAAHALQGSRNPPAARTRVPHGRGGAPSSPQLPRAFRGRPTKRAVYKDSERGRHPRIEYFLPLFFETRRRSSTTCRRARRFDARRRARVLTEFSRDAQGVTRSSPATNRAVLASGSPPRLSSEAAPRASLRPRTRGPLASSPGASTGRGFVAGEDL